MIVPFEGQPISCLLNDWPQRIDYPHSNWSDVEAANCAKRFHLSLPGYEPTPLVQLPRLADRLGVKSLAIKDESKRFDLNAFKVLGASFAIASHLARGIGLPRQKLSFDAVVAHREKYQGTTFVTATDGNHGRAVAWTAKLFGCNSVVYMPKGTAPARLDAIHAFGSNSWAETTRLNYDDTVLFAERKSHEQGWTLLQDTSWDGYEMIPLEIMQGYSSLVTEYRDQSKGVWPTHVFLQAGVGSMAAAVVSFMRRFAGHICPNFIIVEPDGAACLYESLKLGSGGVAKIPGHLETMMAGLACGTPSKVAWETLRHSADAFLRCSDDIAALGIRTLAHPLPEDPSLVSGESGAVTLGALCEIATNQNLSEIKRELDITDRSRLLLFSTEGDTDPELYRAIANS